MSALGPAFHFAASHGADGCQRRRTGEAFAMQVFGSIFGRNGNASGSIRRTSYIFALVLFARAIRAYEGDFSDPLVALSSAQVGDELDSVQTRQRSRYDFGIGELLFPGTFFVTSVVAPVIRIAIQPSSLGAGFVVEVHLSGAWTGLPPAFAPFCLAGRCGAVGLVFDPWVRQEGLAAAGADYWAHQILHTKIRMGTAKLLDAGAVATSVAVDVVLSARR